jgi:dTDP-4-dehydrorhamnose reductase
VKDALLITGGSGLLALNWALATRERYSVTLGVHRRKLAVPQVETRHLPLDAIDSILGALQDLRPRLVVHTAGLTNVEECERDPEAAHYVNTELAQGVARACGRLGLPLVHISTDHLFAGDIPLVDESQPVSPQNVYARTKAEAELLVLSACPNALVVRTNFYGWGPSYRRSFSDSIIDSLRSGKSVTLFDDVYYTPILIEALVHAVHDLVTASAGGIFHVVGDERISKYDFGLRLANHFQLDARLVRRGSLSDHHGLARRPHDMSLSNRKTCDLLGRRLGGVDEHLARLHQQEQDGLAREIQNS